MGHLQAGVLQRECCCIGNNVLSKSLFFQLMHSNSCTHLNWDKTKARAGFLKIVDNMIMLTELSC